MLYFLSPLVKLLAGLVTAIDYKDRKDAAGIGLGFVQRVGVIEHL
jgi:hypothetical protein